MPESSSYLPSVVALGTLMVVSVMITVIRPRLRPAARTSNRFTVFAGLTVLAQCVHFVEEWQTGFFIRLPESFGLQPMPESIFAMFNAIWIAIWVVAILAVRAGYIVATCPLWFLGLAAVLNAVAHPALSFRAGGYYPGVLTAPLVGVLGLLLIRELVRVTET